MARNQEIGGQGPDPGHLNSTTPRNAQKTCKHRTHHCVVCNRPFNRTCLKQRHMIECIVHPGNWSKRGTECEECVLVRECDERQEKKAGTKTKKELDKEEHRQWLEDTTRGRREDKAKWEEKEKDADGQRVAAQAAGVEAIPPNSMVIQDLAMVEEDGEEE